MMVTRRGILPLVGLLLSCTATVVSGVTTEEELIDKNVTQQHTAGSTDFQVGIGVGSKVESTPMCTAAESEFIEAKVAQYTTALARIFFGDDSLEIDANSTNTEIDASYFDSRAFDDFNDYEAKKFLKAAQGGKINLVTKILNNDGDGDGNANGGGNSKGDDAGDSKTVTTTLQAPVAAPIPAPRPLSTPVPRVTKFVLLDPSKKGREIRDLVDGDVIYLDDLPSKLSIGAVTNPPEIKGGSVRMAVNGEILVENKVPYSILSYSKGSSNVAYDMLVPGVKILHAKPFELPENKGQAYTPLTIDFEIIESKYDCTATNCVSLDFNKFPNGTKIQRGAYVTNEWERDYGMIVYVESKDKTAYLPWRGGLRQPRIFDTNRPVEGELGVEDLGSPNQKCKGGGPGVGLGGVPGTGFENCDKLGNVLIIQSENQAVPQPTRSGGRMKFQFQNPVKLNSIGIMDIGVKVAKVHVQFSDKSWKQFSVPKGGRNSVQTVLINEKNVILITVVAQESFAVFNLDFCVPCANVVASSKRQLASIESSGVAIELEDSEQLAQYDRHRQLWLRYNFRWGIQARWRCTYCYGDTKDARKRNLRALGFQDDLRRYLVGALESVISYGLSMDMKYEIQKSLSSQGLAYGCLGNGDELKVVFELI